MHFACAVHICLCYANYSACCMESCFIFLPSIQKEFPRQVVETMLRGVWEVLQGKIWITYCLLPTIWLCHARSCQQCMSRILTCHVQYYLYIKCVQLNLKYTYHTTRNDPHICPHSFTLIFPPAQVLPAGHVPLARLLRLTPEDRTFPAPVKAGRVWHGKLWVTEMSKVRTCAGDQNNILLTP